MAATINSGCPASSVPQILTNDLDEDNIRQVVPAASGWHLLFLRRFVGEPDQEICYLWFDGTRASHVVRLTDDAVDQLDADAAQDAAGNVHLLWTEGPVGNLSLVEVWAAQPAFPSIASRIDNGPFDATNKSFAAATGAALSWGPVPVVPAAIAGLPLSVFVEVAAPGPVGDAITNLPGGVLPNLMTHHPLSTLSVPWWQTYFAGDGLGLAIAGLGIDLGPLLCGPVSMSSPPACLTVPPGLPPGLEIRFQGLVAMTSCPTAPCITSMPLLATNELRVTTF